MRDGVEIEKRTSFAWTTPLSLHNSRETRFDFTPRSYVIHISAVMGPLVVWRERFLRVLASVPETTTGGDGGGGRRDRSRMYCPCIGIHLDT
jgi:hypothetical protein